MSGTSIPDPENTIASNDPGDETGNRYRYQWAWAAVVCCALLDDTQDVEEVFCEHHEDVLLKHKDGSFTAHQVKTRRDDQPPWKANDEDVLAACARFARLESEYPEQVRRYYFLTNHPFYAGKSAQNLTLNLHFIKQVRAASDLPSNVASWVKRVALAAQVTDAVADSAMSKTMIRMDLPKLRDVHVRLISTIVHCWASAAECSYEAVERAAQALIDECGRASSLAHEQLLPAYLIATANADEQIAARVDGKRMTLERVQAVLEEGRNSTAILQGPPTQRVRPRVGSTDLLRRKLDAGGFSAVSISSAEDLRDKVDYLGIKWITLYGESQGLDRYNHIRSLVLADAGRAFDAARTPNDGFGPSMRENLRRRFRERRAACEQLFGATDDHLEGVAFSLTCECTIAWSHARPWEV